MLTYGPYPPPLKARIRSEVGHLSNDVCADTVCELLEMNVRRFVLGHLSQHNNTPDRAFSCTHAALKRLGAVQDREYTLQVAPVKEMARYMVL